MDSTTEETKVCTSCNANPAMEGSEMCADCAAKTEVASATAEGSTEESM